MLPTAALRREEPAGGESELPPTFGPQADMEMKGELAKTLRLNRAACSLGLKDYTAGRNDCDEVLKYMPRDATALRRRGRCRLELADWAGAKADFRAALDVKPDCAERCEKS